MSHPRAGEPWRYPALGFDPLPGDPDIAKALAADAKVFGERMVDSARVIRKAGQPEGWVGKDADAFADEFEELPCRLERCGQAFQSLSQDLTSYYCLFETWKTKTSELECAADAEERTLRELSAVPPAGSPVDVSPLGEIRFQTDDPVVAAQRRLDKIRADARKLRADFEQAARHLAESIMELDEWAPKKPHRSWGDRLVGALGDVAEVGLRLTPVGTVVTAVQAADWLFEEFGSVLSEVSDLMSSMSAFLGFASTLFIWAPGIGQGLALAALATA